MAAPTRQSMHRDNLVKTFYDVIIIGSGPGGAACASEILKGAPNAKVALVEWGRVASIRTGDWDLAQVNERFFANNIATVDYANREADNCCEKNVYLNCCGTISSLRSLSCCLPTCCTGNFHSFPVEQGRAMGGGTYVNARIYVGLSEQDVIDGFDESRISDYRRFAAEYEPRLARKTAPHPLQQAVGRAFTGAPFIADDTFPKTWTNKVVVNRACEEPDRRRITSYTALIAPLAADGKIQTYEDFQVKKIVHDRSGTATGVMAEDGRELEANIIVVACGALFSPALLKLSGLGNEQVGKNLHDHPYLRYAYLSNSKTNDDLSEHHFVNTQYCDAHGVTADFTMGTPGGLVATSQYVQSLSPTKFWSTLCRYPMAVLPCKIFNSNVPIVLGFGWQPKVRGEVIIQPDGTPRVVYDTLSDPDEVAQLNASLRAMVEAIEKEPTMEKYTTPLFAKSELDELKVGGTARPLSHWHVTSSCRMDAKNAPGAVSSSFKLHGTTNVFVGDSSVPRSTSTFNTMSLCYFSGYLCGQEVVKAIIEGGSKKVL